MAELKYCFVSAFVGEDRKEILAGVERIRTEYRVVFNPYTSPCFGGKFESLEDAEEQIERLRPAARKINTANDFEDHSTGRVNVCILLYDIVGMKDFFGEDDVIMRLESIAGGTISHETVESLEEQMIREW